MHRLKAIVHYEHRKGTLQRQSPRLTERCPLLAPRILYGVLYLRQSIIVKPVHMIRCNIQRCIQWCATMCLNKFIGSTTKGSKVELSVFHTTLPYFQSVRVPPVNYFYSHCAHCWMQRLLLHRMVCYSCSFQNLWKRKKTAKSVTHSLLISGNPSHYVRFTLPPRNMMKLSAIHFYMQLCIVHPMMCFNMSQ
jgi:hypothetical protein